MQAVTTIGLDIAKSVFQVGQRLGGLYQAIVPCRRQAMRRTLRHHC